MRKNTKPNSHVKILKRKPLKKEVPAFSLRKRNIALISLMSFVFLGIVMKAGYTQITHSEVLLAEGEKRIKRVKVLTPLRGVIYDRNNKELAVSTAAYSIIVSPRDVIKNDSFNKNKNQWLALAKAINVPYKKLKNDVVSAYQINDKSNFIYLARQVPINTERYIDSLNIAEISAELEQRRFYPESSSTANLIGFTNVDGSGIEGIEKSLNADLSGESGKLVYIKDKQGNIIERVSVNPQKNGKDVTLSIDKDLQNVVYQDLVGAIKENKAKSGSAIVVDVKTGEILTMVNAPSFNPNNKKTLRLSSIKNGSINDLFEPGSTVKPFVVLAALENNLTNLNEVFNTKALKIGNKSIEDVAKRDVSTLTEIIENSSNIGVSKLALRMNSKLLVDTYSEFGLGRPVGLPLSEARGWLKNKTKWSDIDKATFAYGYGMMVTPIQIAKAYTGLANFGVSIPLSIFKLEDGVKIQGTRHFSELNSKRVIKMMEGVAKRGGKAASIEGYTVAVKTGTAKKSELGQYVDKYVAYTAGIAPANNPKYVVVIMINEPSAGAYYGGAVAAPVFSKVMKRALEKYNIPMDAPINNELATLETIKATDHDYKIDHYMEKRE